MSMSEHDERSNRVTGRGRRGPIALRLKRVMDVVCAGAGLALLSPLLVATAVAVRWKLGSPVLFRQRRPGLGGRPFTIFKFRTMREPQAGQSRFVSDEERLTPLGRFLRRSSIDELPELLNVLKGDMSLVGPRPLLMQFLERYTAEQAKRHDMPPGITGLAQISGRQHIPFSKRLELDVSYVEGWSLGLDLRILLRTLLVVVRGSGVESGQRIADIDDIGLFVPDAPCPEPRSEQGASP